MYEDFMKYQKVEGLTAKDYTTAINNSQKIAEKIKEFDIKPEYEIPSPKMIMKEEEI